MVALKSDPCIVHSAVYISLLFVFDQCRFFEESKNDNSLDPSILNRFYYLDTISLLSVFGLTALLKLEITVHNLSGVHCQFIQGH